MAWSTQPYGGIGARPQAAPPVTSGDAPSVHSSPMISAPAAPAAPAAEPPAPANPDVGALGTSPAYLSYMRAIGLKDADAAAASQQATARVQARLSNGLADSQRAQQQAGYNLGNRLEASGQGTSSVGQYDAAHQAAVFGAREEAMRQAAADNVANILARMALAHQAGDVGLTERGLSTAPQVALGSAAANNFGVPV